MCLSFLMLLDSADSSFDHLKSLVEDRYTSSPYAAAQDIGILINPNDTGKIILFAKGRLHEKHGAFDFGTVVSSLQSKRNDFSNTCCAFCPWGLVNLYRVLG